MSDGLDAELRRAFVAPLLLGAPFWFDLARDADPGADLSTPEGVAAIAAALDAAPPAEDGRLVLTAFDVLDGLDDITPLMGWLVALGDRATVVVSVPWPANQVEELRRLVPGETLVARQVPVRAAAILTDERAAPPLGAVALDAGAAASHHLLAFGPDVGRLQPVSAARAADLSAEQAEDRRRAADLAYLEARIAQLEG